MSALKNGSSWLSIILLLNIIILLGIILLLNIIILLSLIILLSIIRSESSFIIPTIVIAAKMGIGSGITLSMAGHTAGKNAKK